jgi:hypothetical protein
VALLWSVTTGLLPRRHGGVPQVALPAFLVISLTQQPSAPPFLAEHPVPPHVPHELAQHTSRELRPPLNPHRELLSTETTLNRARALSAAALCTGTPDASMDRYMPVRTLWNFQLPEDGFHSALNLLPSVVLGHWTSWPKRAS